MEPAVSPSLTISTVEATLFVPEQAQAMLSMIAFGNKKIADTLCGTDSITIPTIELEVTLPELKLQKHRTSSDIEGICLADSTVIALCAPLLWWPESGPATAYYYALLRYSHGSRIEVSQACMKLYDPNYSDHSVSPTELLREAMTRLQHTFKASS